MGAGRNDSGGQACAGRRVCPNCGEEYVDEAVTSELLKTAEDAARSGVQVDIREYVAA